MPHRLRLLDRTTLTRSPCCLCRGARKASSGTSMCVWPESCGTNQPFPAPSTLTSHDDGGQARRCGGMSIYRGERSATSAREEEAGKQLLECLHTAAADSAQREWLRIFLFTHPSGYPAQLPHPRCTPRAEKKNRSEILALVLFLFGAGISGCVLSSRR
jgi:hypothetical protein